MAGIDTLPGDANIVFASGQSKQHSRYVDNLFSTSEWRNFAKSGQTDPY